MSIFFFFIQYIFYNNYAHIQLEDCKYMLEIYKQKLCKKLEKQRLIYDSQARQLQKRLNKTIALKCALDIIFASSK